MIADDLITAPLIRTDYLDTIHVSRELADRLIEEYYDIMIHNQLIAHMQDEGVNAIVAPYMKDEIVAMLAAPKD